MLERLSHEVGNAPIVIERQQRPLRDKIVPHRKFGAVAHILFPKKTAAYLAAIGKTDERTGKRWLRGENIPPLCVVIACIEEMFRELSESEWN